MLDPKSARVLVIGSGWEQRALISTIRDEGHFIVATNPVINADGFPLADVTYVKSSRDIQSHIAIAKTQRVGAVIADNCDFSLYTASVVAAKLNLPFVSMQAAIFSNDKLEQRRRCRQAGIKQPDFRKIRSIEDARTAARDIGFPCILKPVDARGTFGVTVIESPEALDDAFYDAVGNSDSRILILERFVKGTLITVDGFCFRNGHRSLAVASRKHDDGPKPVTKEIIYPAQLSTSTNNCLLQFHDDVVSALGYSFGHTHGEYILSDADEVFLVECTNRGGGVYTSSTILPRLTGIDLNRILINQAAGKDDYEAPNLGLGFMKKSIMLTFIDFEENRVIKSINTREMLDEPYTVKFRTLFSENDMVQPIRHCASRHSMLVVEGDNAHEMLNNFKTFQNKLKVEYYH